MGAVTQQHSVASEQLSHIDRLMHQFLYMSCSDNKGCALVYRSEDKEKGTVVTWFWAYTSAKVVRAYLHAVMSEVWSGHQMERYALIQACCLTDIATYHVDKDIVLYN